MRDETLPMGASFFHFSNKNCTPSTNAELTIFFCVNLVQSNPVKGAAKGHILDANGSLFETVRWDDHAWLFWVKQFREQCSRFWDRRFWLVPPDYASLSADLDFPACRPTHRVNILCRFHIVITAIPPAREVPVVCLPDTEKYKFRSHKGLFDNRDLQMDKNGYVEAFHEVGHWLLLEHPICAGDAPVCYGFGNPNPTFFQNIMGGGRQVRSYQAKPWMTVMRAFFPKTEAKDWNPYPREMTPRPLHTLRIVNK